MRSLSVRREIRYTFRVPKSTRRLGSRKGFVGLSIGGAFLASSMACSLFVDMGGLQDGSSDAAAGSDVVAANDTSNPSDAPASDSIEPVVDSGNDAESSAGPIAFVQTTDFDPVDGGSGDMTFTTPVFPGDAIIVCAFLTGTPNAAVSDDKGDSFDTDVGPFTDANGDRVWIFSVIHAIGNEQKIHVEIGGGGAMYTELYAMEYSGIAAFDVGIGNYSATGGDVSSGFVTTAVANEMLLGFAVDGAVTKAPTFVARDTANDDLVEDRVAGAPGPYAATATMSGAGTVLVAAYR